LSVEKKREILTLWITRAGVKNYPPAAQWEAQPPFCRLIIGTISPLGNIADESDLGVFGVGNLDRLYARVPSEEGGRSCLRRGIVVQPGRKHCHVGHGDAEHACDHGVARLMNSALLLRFSTMVPRSPRTTRAD
jgi:hypothetical protein